MHLKFPSITSFKDVFASQTYRPDSACPLDYGMKIKLHGANVAVRLRPAEAPVAQSRNQDLCETDDPYGFHGWLQARSELWARAGRQDTTLTFYGEWAGPGVAKGDAVQQTGKKRFYIFALGLGEWPHHQNPDIATPRWMITCPLKIRAFLPEDILGDDVRILPWETGEPVVFDFTDPSGIAEQLAVLNRAVDQVAVCDPYIARTFGISHPGEGFVLVPVSSYEEQVSAAYFARTAFKAKTEKHRVRGTARAASVHEPLPATAADFIATFCTQARLTQALEEVCQGRADIRQTGAMITWMTGDVEKEGFAEISALCVPPERLKADIAEAVRSWFVPRAKAQM